MCCSAAIAVVRAVLRSQMLLINIPSPEQNIPATPSKTRLRPGNARKLSSIAMKTKESSD